MTSWGRGGPRLRGGAPSGARSALQSLIHTSNCSNPRRLYVSGRNGLFFGGVFRTVKRGAADVRSTT